MKVRNLVIAAILPMVVGTGAYADPCDPSDPTLQKPDLVALPPSRVRVLQRGNIRRIIFATKIANQGVGPLTIQGKTIITSSGPVTEATQIIKRSDGSDCTLPAGAFEFHATHNHYHLNDFSSYELYKDGPRTGPLVAKSDKISFCIADIEPVRGVDTPRQVLAHCGTQEGIQGISVGWADVYDNYLPEQWIDVPPNVPAGQYFLSNTADPDNFLLEINDSAESNSGTVSVTLPNLIGVGNPAPEPTATNTVGTDPTPTPQTTPGTRPTRPPRHVINRPAHPVRPDRPPRPTPIRNN